MRKMEAEGRFQSGMLKPADKADQDSYKTRKGKPGGYIDHLSPQEIVTLNKKMYQELDPFFGYTGNLNLEPDGIIASHA
jgi:hypothetical protein